MKRLVLLGASGSIGLQTIDIIEKYNQDFKLVALSVGKRINILKDILARVDVSYVCVGDENEIPALKKEYPNITFFSGDDGLNKLAQLNDYDTLVNALVGAVGVMPTLCAIKNKKDIALANKETLVVAGKFVIDACKENNVNLYPIDSEHSAIFQCLKGIEKKELKKLIITASGGSFRNKSREELKNVTLQEALNHPNWSMGAKITIDSATMMNKGFEVIEAHWLFDVEPSNIEVVMHPQSVIHSMIQTIDGAILAQLGSPDMHLPIQYALTYPYRKDEVKEDNFNLTDVKDLTFTPVDYDRFPLLKLAYDCLEKGGTACVTLNAANEVANKTFQEGKISFLQIEEYIFDAMKNVEFIMNPTLDDIFDIDKKTREYVIERIGKC